MDFGVRPMFDGHGTPVPDATLRLAWFERSSAERSSAGEPGLAEEYGMLDRFREADGLVYNGDGDHEA